MRAAVMTRFRSDGRPHDTGLIRPYRELPDDFREVFLRLGQDRAIEEHYRTNWRVIRRWIEEAGGDELRAERARLTGSALRPVKRSGLARRYVLGLRLRSQPQWPCRAPRFWDVGLVSAEGVTAPPHPLPARLQAMITLRLVRSGEEPMQIELEFGGCDVLS